MCSEAGARAVSHTPICASAMLVTGTAPQLHVMQKKSRVGSGCHRHAISDTRIFKSTMMAAGALQHSPGQELKTQRNTRQEDLQINE